MRTRIASFAFLLFLASSATAQESITAVYAETPPRIDGVLDDPIWDLAPVADRFVQREPNDGAEPTHPSAMRIAFDEENLYFGLSFYDSEPELIRARNLERGGPNGNDDMFWLLIDTYNDDRNAYLFETNVLGTQDDAIISDESMQHSDWQWDGIYHSEGRIAEDGWHVELAIPFKTIRFDNKEELTMGVALMRFLNRTGERSMWPHIPRSYSAGIFQVSQYADLRGVRNVERGRNVLIKPFIITGAQDVRTSGTSVTDTQQDVGLDVKWAVNPNVTVDVTLNTDFAQVESDNVQLDLTRFNLFFPEKREFFLERQALFTLGNTGETETFFSRRIGISNDILAGARVVGQFDRLSVGVMNIQTEANDILDATNNTVLRLRADVFGRTTVGGILTNLEQGDRFNRAFGVDARSRFMGNSEASAWYTRVEDSNPLASDAAGAIALSWRRADYQIGVNHTQVGKRFNPALGFVSRRDMKRYQVNAGYNPQVNGKWVRAWSVSGVGALVNGQDNELQSSDVQLNGQVHLQSNDMLLFNAGQNFERLEHSFFVRPDAEILAGDYTARTVAAGIQSDNSRFLSGRAIVRTAEFFGGDRMAYQFGFGVRTGKYLNFDAIMTHNRFDLPIPNGEFTATSFGMNINAAWSRKLFAKALIQYDNFSGNVQANIRIDWIHSPGADLFLVFNTNYNMLNAEDQFDVRAATLNNRVGVAKLTYVVQL
ncbi:MAG: DUF5916 domain-containing protein [Rhodothermales bacterium]